MSLSDKADVCLKEGVTVLICGAISSIGNAILQDKHVKVISWIRGPVHDVIAAYLTNSNVSEKFSMPGCGRMLCRKNKLPRHIGGHCGMR